MTNFGAVATNTPLEDLSITSDNATTARDLSARFAELRNVLDFGADPTGATDSAAAIQAAVDAAGSSGSVVYIPEGEYRVLTKVQLPANVSVIGAGYSTLLFTPEGSELADPDPDIGRGDGLLMTDAQGVYIANLRIRGPAPPDQPAGQMPEQRSNGISLLSNSSDCIIENVWISKCSQNAIQVHGTRHHVSRVIATDNIVYGISFGHWRQAVPGASYCTVSQFYASGSVAKSGIEVNDGSHHITFSDFICRNNFQHEITITDHAGAEGDQTVSHLVFVNGLLETKDSGLAVNVNTNTAATHKHLTFANIHVKNAATAFRFPGPCVNIRVIGCTTGPDVRRLGQLLETGDGKPQEIYFIGCRADAADAGGSANQLEIQDAVDVRVSGCTLRNAGGHGILVHDSSGVRIDDCEIINPAQAAGTRHGILLEASVAQKDLKIHGCRIVRTTGNMVNGINYDDNYDNAIITHNHIRGQSGDQIGGDAVPGTALSENNLA